MRAETKYDRRIICAAIIACVYVVLWDLTEHPPADAAGVHSSDQANAGDERNLRYRFKIGPGI